MGCVLGQHDETGKKEHAIYYLSKEFTDYESKYPSVKKMCCALAWIAQTQAILVIPYYMVDFQIGSH